MIEDQNNFSAQYRQMYDVEVRIKKAKKTLSILNDFLKNTENLTLLDLGCSTGIMTNQYSKIFNNTLGIDIDKSAVDYANKNYKNNHLEFHNSSYEDISPKKKKFDVIILAVAHDYFKNISSEKWKEFCNKKDC